MDEKLREFWITIIEYPAAYETRFELFFDEESAKDELSSVVTNDKDYEAEIVHAKEVLPGEITLTREQFREVLKKHDYGADGIDKDSLEDELFGEEKQ